MKIDTSVSSERRERHPYKGRVSVNVDGQEIEGQVDNISISGLAINTHSAFENAQFVDLHIDGIGAAVGRVTRVYDGGIAVQFDAEQSESSAVGQAIRKFDQRA